jgi:predicted RNase H-like HicB family nuclease
MSMLRKSKSSKSLRLKPAFIARARPIAEKYQMIIWKEDGEYYGRGVELPYSFGDGKTVDQCAKDTREAFVVTVASMLQDGELPPAPATEGKRDQQINIRVSSVEKVMLESRARESGAAGISEYVRAVALSKIIHAP